MSQTIPNWVYDVVIALQKWNDEHGELYMLRFDGEYIREKGCCYAYNYVPSEIKEIARVIAEYKNNV